MYSTVLIIHSWVRWAVVFLAVAATVNAARPLMQGSLVGRAWDRVFMLAIDIQVLIGLILYFGLSPFTVEAMNDMGLAMKTPQLRYWAVEHITGMFIVMALVRMGRIMSANAKNAPTARSRRLICFELALVVLLASIPWPGMTAGRPLFRFE